MTAGFELNNDPARPQRQFIIRIWQLWYSYLTTPEVLWKPWVMTWHRPGGMLRLVAINGSTVQVPYHLAKSQNLNWVSSTCKLIFSVILMWFRWHKLCKDKCNSRMIIPLTATKSSHSTWCRNIVYCQVDRRSVWILKGFFSGQWCQEKMGDTKYQNTSIDIHNLLLLFTGGNIPLTLSIGFELCHNPMILWNIL